MQKAAKTKVLTVGDGDLSFSLALSRAYGEDSIDVTASVLETDSSEFLRVFPDAPLEELRDRKVRVLYGVDATQLHLGCLERRWDLVSFHHPHLGMSNLDQETEAQRALLHHRLLCHYLHSASKVSKLVHVCLAGNQPTTWKLWEAAKLQNLKLVRSLPDTKPFATVWMENCEQHPMALPEPSAVQSHYGAPRKYRNGKLGKHALAKYGYKHRRTEGVLFKGSCKDANVSESTHFVFSKLDGLSSEDVPSQTCPICLEPFESEDDLAKHLVSPTVPRRHLQIHQDSKTSSRPPQPLVASSLGDENLLIVPPDCAGKRLRWFLQHSNRKGLKFTKRLAESTIQSGLISVNGAIALDSSRILKAKDRIVLLKGDRPTKKTSCKRVEIPSCHSGWLVALKPSGMRTKGMIEGSLETIVSEQTGDSYVCLSSLETSCPGLCVLVRRNMEPAISINHVLTVLVHGELPPAWFPSLTVSIVPEGKWRRKKKHQTRKVTAPTPQTAISVDFYPQESTKGLSTLRVVTPNPSSSTICHFLRREGFPVVGDSFCKQEYQTLKRSIKNRLKDKLCIGCYRVEITEGRTQEPLVVEVPSPAKLSAKHWENFVEKATCAETRRSHETNDPENE